MNLTKVSKAVQQLEQERREKQQNVEWKQIQRELNVLEIGVRS